MSLWTRFTLIGAACCICPWLAPSAWAQKDKPTCAVLTLDAKGGISQEEAALLTDRFAAEFDKLGRYQILNRSKMKEILDQQNFARSESCSAAECAVEAGKLLAAQKMVYGTVGKFGELYTVNTCLIDVETGSQERSGTSDFRGPKEDVLTVLMAANAHKLLGLKPPSEALQSKDVIVTQPVPRYQADYAPPMNARDDYAPARRQSHEPEPEAAYIGPKIGVSFYTGLAGLEAQFGHISLCAGTIGDGAAGGVKYYFDKARSSWYLGVCGWNNPGDDSEDEEESSTSFFGFGLGYRWRGGDGWDFALGSGIGRKQEEEDEDSETTDQTFPVIDLAFGYSF